MSVVPESTIVLSVLNYISKQEYYTSDVYIKASFVYLYLFARYVELPVSN